MTFLANTKKLKSKYITFLGLNFLLNTPQSLTPQRFRAIHEEGYGLAGINDPKRMDFTKKVICVPLGFLVTFFMTEQARQAWVELLAYRLCHQSPGP